MAFDKVVDSVALDTELKNLADILREKSETTEELDFYAGDFSQTAESIETGAEARAEIETLIDESGVLDSTEGTATEKIEQLIGFAQWEEVLYEISRNWTTQFQSFFAYPEAKIALKLCYEKALQLNYTFCDSGIERIDYYINCKNATSMWWTFKGAKNLKFIYGINSAKVKKFQEAFCGCTSLETIQEPLNFQSVAADGTNLTFWECRSLKHIKFVAETIKTDLSFVHSVNLTPESIQSIINGLATVETAQTLTLNSAITLTDEQLATINSKGWTLAQ